MKKYLSKGNHKLPTTTLIFNLPAVKTCPGSTVKCRKWCYARKSEVCYPQVLPFRMNNWQLSKQDNFVEVISEEIKRSRTVKTIRCHESGDFYNEEYFEKWVDIALAFPELKFYAYTKVVTLGTKFRPDNFVLLLSDDDSVFTTHWSNFDGVTTVTPKKAQPEKGWFVCPGNCRTCNKCYDDTETKRVTFLEH